MYTVKKHVEYPLCWASHAVLWLIDGYGVESNRHISVRSRLSEVVLVRVSDGCDVVNDKHFVLFNSSDVFCIVTGTAVSYNYSHKSEHIIPRASRILSIDSFSSKK